MRDYKREQKRGIIIFLLVIVVLLILVAIYFVWGKNQNPSVENNQIKNDNQIIRDDVDNET